MSRRLDVLKALADLVRVALPGAKVVGLDDDAAAPQSIPASGMVIVRSGDPGDPDVDLSPLAYNWTHRIPLEVSSYASANVSSEEALDEMLTAIDAAIAADRTLGGLCDWVEPQAPLTEDIYTDGTEPPRGADLAVVATYTTATPLS